MSWLLYLMGWAALLAGWCYLCTWRRKQLCYRRMPRQDPKKWTGHGFDASQLKPRLQNVRQDFVAARQTTRGVGFHRALLVLARHTVQRLGYFRDREPEEHTQRRWL